MSASKPITDISASVRCYNTQYNLIGKKVKVAFMTSGGLAPCLSASIAQLIQYWCKALDDGKISGLEFRCYIAGYKGVLTGDSFVLPEDEWESTKTLNKFGGSPIGNSRVKVRTEYVVLSSSLIFSVLCSSLLTGGNERGGALVLLAGIWCLPGGLLGRHDCCLS